MTAPPGPIPRALAAVVLAAGRGERLGGRPKALLELDGEPLVRRTVAALRAAGITDVVVVTGHHACLVEPALRSLEVRLVRNADPDAGPASSQRLGLAAVPRADADVVMALADQPLVDADALAALVDAWRRRPPGIEVLHPLVDGERGNPVICAAAARVDILAGPPTLGCRQWQAAHPARVWAWPSADARYRLDIDTPEDLARFARQTGRALHWPASVAP